MTTIILNKAPSSQVRLQRKFSWLALLVALLCGGIFSSWLHQEQGRVIVENTKRLLLWKSLSDAGVAAMAVAPDGNITRTTQAIIGLTGYSEAELQGQPLNILIPKEYQAAHKTGFMAALEDGKDSHSEVDCKLLTKSGEAISITGYIAASEYGGVAIIQPITAQKPTLKTLKILVKVANTDVRWFAGQEINK